MIKNIIGLFGERCTGKSEAAEFLAKHGSFTIITETDLKEFTESSLCSFLHAISLNSTPGKEELEVSNKPRKNSAGKKRKSISLKTLINSKAETSPFVVLDFSSDYHLYEELFNRNNFKLVYITAPAKLRLQKYIKRGELEENIDNYNTFLDLDYKITSNELYYKLLDRKDYTIVNEGGIDEFEFFITKLLSSIDTFPRPTWDQYFMNVCHIVARRSNCLKQKVGALLVSNNRIVSAGYNGTPTGFNNCYSGGCDRCKSSARKGEFLDNCFCMHAEENAIVEVGRKACENATLYSTVFPCLLCLKLILNCGIKRVVFDATYDQSSQDFTLSKEFTSIKIEQFNKALNVLHKDDEANRKEMDLFIFNKIK
jgi:dCMP deaminase